MIRYGKEDCEHVWRHRKGGWEEECGPAICIECGAFGCFCDVYKGKVTPPKEIFFREGVEDNANINGKWINPYIKKEN